MKIIPTEIKKILLVFFILCAMAIADANENSGTGVVYDAHENAYKTRKIGNMFGLCRI